jgi:hypothetical protein
MKMKTMQEPIWKIRGTPIQVDPFSGNVKLMSFTNFFILNCTPYPILEFDKCLNLLKVMGCAKSNFDTT